MAIDNKGRDEKLQYDINKEARIIYSSKVDKYKYLAGQKVLLFNQSQMI